MIQHFVFDTVSFINYHCDFFNEKSRLSSGTIENLRRCFSADFVNYKLIVPSIIFVEIFDKQLKTDERAARFKSEILSKYLDCEDVEIKNIDKEVLHLYANIDNNIIKLETHDKIILSSAIQMNGKLITNDAKIKEYVEKTNVVELTF